MRLRVQMTFQVRVLSGGERQADWPKHLRRWALPWGNLFNSVVSKKKKQKKKQASGVLQLQAQVSINERNCKCVGSASCLFPAMAVAVNAVAKWPPVNTPVNRRDEHVTRKWSVR